MIQAAHRQWGYKRGVILLCIHSVACLYQRINALPTCSSNLEGSSASVKLVVSDSKLRSSSLGPAKKDIQRERERDNNVQQLRTERKWLL